MFPTLSQRRPEVATHAEENDSFCAPSATSGLFCVFGRHKGERTMADILLICTGVLFFIVAAAYTRACDRL